MQARQQSVRPASQSFYTAAGRFICVDAQDEWSARLFERFFAGWHLSPLHTDIAPLADSILKIRCNGSPPSLPAGIDGFELASGGRCRTDGRTYYFEECGSLTVVHPGTPCTVEVWVGDTEWAREPVSLARLVFNASLAAMRRCGLYELHGGAVIEPDSAGGVLFVGPSGSGKSTLTLQLAAAGWRYLSDDTLLLSEGTDAIEARGLRRVFAVTENTIASGAWASLADVSTAPVPFDPLKRRFEPHELFPTGFAQVCIPRMLFFPSITHERESRLKKLSRHEAMARLLKMCPWACYDKPSARRHLGTLARLARQSTAYDLSAGTDLLGDPDYTAKFFAACAGEVE